VPGISSAQISESGITADFGLLGIFLLPAEVHELVLEPAGSEAFASLTTEEAEAVICINIIKTNANTKIALIPE
jgi:hypothetical protein